MLSGWHVAHLPVRLMGRPRVWQMIDQVVVSWPELELDGFLLMPRPLYVPFVPAHATFRLTGMGLELAGTAQVQRRSRRWRRHLLQRHRTFMNQPVTDSGGRLHGRLKDIIFDETTMHVTHVVVSRGVLGDLLSGSLVLPASDVTQITAAAVKIQAPGAPFL